MIKLLLLMILIFGGACSLWADDGVGDDDQFVQELNTVKNPFEDGLPKPVVVKKLPPPPVQHIVIIKPKPVVIIPKVVVPEIKLPDLKLQGVMVGEQMHQAIINGDIVSLQDTIDGAKVISIRKSGVSLLYMGKKFFLKVE